MIDWSSVVCGGGEVDLCDPSRGLTTALFIPQLLHTFLLLAFNCQRAKDTCPVVPHGGFARDSNSFQPDLQTGPLIYSPAPGYLGVEVRGIDLKRPVAQHIVDQILEDVHKYRILIFKDQGLISGDRHAEIGRWFGELESDFQVHKKAPNKDIYRLSNDAKEGITNVGIRGFHTDGHWFEKPFSFAIYHIVSPSKQGNTSFAGLKELVESLSPETRARWERLWRVAIKTYNIHPVMFPHPVTREPSMCFHNGYTNGFIWNYNDTVGRRQTDKTETRQIMDEIEREIKKDDRRLIYSHSWEAGDFMISDNFAVCHEAAQETARPISEVGLRILHRVTVAGKWVPLKDLPPLEAPTPLED